MAESTRQVFVSSTGSDAHTGKNQHNAKASFAAVIAISDEEDVINIAPGGYNETVSLAANRSNLSLVGSGGRGAAFIEPETVGAEGMLVLGDDITLRNFGVAGEETSSYSLQVGDATHSPARFRAYGCKFEGAPVVLKGAGDALFEDCEFAWSDLAVVFDDNNEGFCTQIVFKNCRFHNITEAMFSLAATGGVRNLLLIDCVFDRAEDGTAPTDFIVLADDGENVQTGLITGCRFAYATHEADVITIPAGVLYVGNYAESGVNTARPS